VSKESLELNKEPLLKRGRSMKKRDFKKLMLLGISAGALVASQAGADQGTLLAGGCGGKNGCKGYMPYPPSHGCASTNNYNNNNNGAGQNNGGYTAYQPTHSCSAHQPYYTQQSQGCASYAPQASYQQQPQQQISHGCASAQPQMSHSCSSNNGCGGAPQPNYRPAQPQTANRPAQPQQNQTTYNQWSNATGGFTADASKPAAATTARPAAHGAKLTESDLLSAQSPLNPTSKEIFHGLDAEGKTLALKLVNQSCKGQNECKGLNACKSKDHSCAGRGSCSGTSEGPFTDKNQAIKIAAQKMAEKRAGAAPASR
jgi:hypothetical protein